MISSDWNYDTVVSRFVTARLSSLAKTDDTIPGFSLPFDREFVSEHKLFEPVPHHRVSQIFFLFGRHNEMWVRVRFGLTGTLAKILFVADLPPLVIVALRTII